jgi:hypothetical protein
MFNALVKMSSAMLALLCVSAATADDALRFQKDGAGGRGWLLTRNGVAVLDLGTRRTIARVPLPGWTWADEAYSCPPDLALGPKGEALVSSNVVPTLWRVDPVTLAVSRHELTVDAHGDKDVGFTGLVYASAQGAFFAVSQFGALWRIDPLLRRAQKIELSAPIAGACGVAVRTARNGFNRFFGLCVSGPQGGWTVHLAPDRRSGYVLGQPCK